MLAIPERMENKDLSGLTDEDLKNKLKGLRSLSWICLLAAAFLLFFIIRDSLNGNDLETSLLIIAICSIGGGVSLSPQIKEIKAEMERRG